MSYDDALRLIEAASRSEVLDGLVLRSWVPGYFAWLSGRVGLPRSSRAADLRHPGRPPYLRRSAAVSAIPKARQRFPKFTFPFLAPQRTRRMAAEGEGDGGGSITVSGGIVLNPSLDRTEHVLHFRLVVEEPRGIGVRPGRLRSLGQPG